MDARTQKIFDERARISKALAQPRHLAVFPGRVQHGGDYQFYSDAPTTWFTLDGDSFVIFYPEDAHAPANRRHPAAQGRSEGRR